MNAAAHIAAVQAGISTVVFDIEPSTKKKTRMLTKAMTLAKRPSEMKLVMAALGTLPAEQSLNILLPHLNNAAVRNEAASAIIAVAAEMGKKNKTQAVDALRGVLEKCEDAGIRKSAQRTLARFK